MMIRVQIPQHLKTLSKVVDEVHIETSSTATIEGLISALEDLHPVLRGTIREHVSLKRRPWIRYFAFKEDLSHEPVDMVLPEKVLSGDEPFIILGAIAGG